MNFMLPDVKKIGARLGVVWDSSPFDPKTLQQGMEVELEHKDVTDGDPVKTAQIALVHLHERPDYYAKLEDMEEKPVSRGKSEVDGPLVGSEKKVGEH